MNTRRDFLAVCGKVIAGAAMGSTLLPILQSCAPTSMPIGATPATVLPGPDGRYAVSVADLSAGNPVKVAQGLVGPDAMPVLVTRLSDTDFRALSMYCTHQGCRIESTEQNGGIPCLCHGSKFGLDGSVQIGPATTPLHQYDAVLDQNSSTLHIKLT